MGEHLCEGSGVEGGAGWPVSPTNGHHCLVQSHQVHTVLFQPCWPLEGDGEKPGVPRAPSPEAPNTVSEG